MPLTGSSCPERLSQSGSVAVVGSGAAGLMAALVASECAPVTVITDRALGKSNSAMAQGGLQCPEDNPESVDSFRADIQRSARLPLDSELTARFAAEARATVLELAALGLELDRDETGAWRRRSAGGISEPRVVTTGDRIGTSVMRVLVAALRKRHVSVLEWTDLVDIQCTAGGFHLSLADRHDHYQQRFHQAVVIATGGSAFHHAAALGQTTTNPANQNDRAQELLRGLGLEEVHAGLFQCQPFGLVTANPRAVGKAFPESILDFPVRIVGANDITLLEPNEKPDRLTLCERLFDAERRSHTLATTDGRSGFRLCLEELRPSLLEAYFPSAMSYLRKHQGRSAPVLVRPFVHYQLGGFRIGADCQTALPGLFLAGEVTGGLHGLNRLMGNGLTDALVHGRRAGRQAVRYLDTLDPERSHEPAGR